MDHAALHLPAVLGSGDDLLTGVAALTKVDAAQGFEVHHLRHELILRGARDERAAGADLLQRPLHLVRIGRLIQLRSRTELQETTLADANRSHLTAPRHVTCLEVAIPDAK